MVHSLSEDHFLALMHVLYMSLCVLNVMYCMLVRQVELFVIERMTILVTLDVGRRTGVKLLNISVRVLIM